MSQNYRLFGKQNQNEGIEDIGGVDWIDFAAHGRGAALALVQEAAASTSPGLKRAAEITLEISNTIQQFKNHNTKFAVLGDESIAFTAVVWRSCQSSSSQLFWPKVGRVIDELATTLNLICKYIAREIATGDGSLIDDHRRKLGLIVTKFENAFNLTIKAALESFTRGQQIRRNAEHMSMRFSDMQINNSRSSPTPAYAAVVRQGDENLSEILAAAERYKQNEKEYMSGEKDHKKKRPSVASPYRCTIAESDDDDETSSEDNADGGFNNTPASRKSEGADRPRGPQHNQSLPLGGFAGSMSTSMPGLHTTMDATMGSMSTIMGSAFNNFPGHQNSYQTSSGSTQPPPPYASTPSTQSNAFTPQPNYAHPQPHMHAPPYPPHPIHANSYPQYHQHSPFPQQYPPPQQQYFPPQQQSFWPNQYTQMGWPPAPASPQIHNMSTSPFGPGVIINNSNNSGNVINHAGLSNMYNDNRVITYPAPKKKKRKPTQDDE